MKPFFITYFVTISAVGVAQDIGIELGMGYGSYSMKELKEFQLEIESQFPIKAKVTESFPGFWNYRGSVSWIKEKVYFGVDLSYGSTGGRVHYKDYSGQLYSDQLTQYFSIGSILGIFLNPKNESFSFQVNFIPAIVLGKLELDYVNIIGTSQVNYQYIFRSINVCTEAQLKIEKKFKVVGLYLSCGYNYNLFKGKLFFDENRDTYLLNEKNNEVGLNWAGIRLSAGISHRIQY